MSQASGPGLSLPTPGAAPSFVVGIGASAGGLESIEAFFDAMPPDTGMAFVVIQHLSPNFKSLMSELLAPRTKMRIFKAEDGMVLQRNCVYLNPPKTEMSIDDGHLRLRDFDSSLTLHLPIDTFFHSLGGYAGDRAVAVVLSGSGTDGSRGIRSVHEAGGFVVVQQEESAKFDGMPRSAVATGCVDLVLPPEQIANAVVRYTLNSRPGQVQLEDLASGDSLVGYDDDANGETEQILGLLRERYNLDFLQYKPATVKRRIERRVLISQYGSMEAYLTALRADPEQIDLLYRDLLIGVTKFFRDQEAFAVLEPELKKRVAVSIAHKQAFRAWVAGCATGEEAYSLAIQLHEICQVNGWPPNIKIFATDVHVDSLERASAGVYGRDELSDLSAALIDRYFVPHGNHFKVVPEIRRGVIFAPHNLIKDPPFTKIDLVSCRNLLIYLQPVAQKRVLGSFDFALNPDGLLLLGPSETVGELSGEFESLDTRWKLFVKRKDPPLQSLHRRVFPPMDLRTGWSIPMRQQAGPQDLRLLRAFEQLLQKFVPPSLLVNERGDLLHAFGDSTKLLRQPAGRATLNVLDLVDDELRIALGAAMQKVLRDRSAVTYEGIRVPDGDGEMLVNLVIEPLSGRSTDGVYLLLSFEPIRKAITVPTPPSQFQVTEESRHLITELEQELQYTKEHLNAVVEELETSNEELQSTNEELISSNEELQSTNEELHSVNEELYSVNSEFQSKIEELTSLSNDMENLLQSTDVGVVFLDRDLRIRRFTRAIAQSFNLLPQDVGRPIDHISHKILHDGMLADVQKVLETSSPVEREVINHRGIPLFMRALPYRTATNAVDGVVLTFVDISPIKRAQEELRASEERFRTLVEHLDPIFWITSADDRDLLYISPAYERVYGRSIAALHENPRDWLEAVHPEDRDRAREIYARNPALEYELEYRVTSTHGDLRWIRARYYPVFDEAVRLQRIVGFAEDITREKGREHSLRLTQYAVDRAADAVFWLSSSAHFVYANESGCRLLGATLPELLSSRFDDFHYPQDEELWRRFLHDSETQSISLESTVRDRTGRMTPVEISAGHMDVDGVEYICLILRDITERNKRIEMLQQMNEILQKNQDLDDFAHLASHDLKEPLRNIITFSALLAEDLGGQLSEQGSKDLQFITSSAERMQSLINDLLALSKAGRAEMECSKFSLQAVVSGTLESLAVQLAARNGRVDMEDLPEIYADRLLIGQLMQNLIGNALKFASDRPCRIRVTARVENARWVFGVMDNGIGVRPEHQEVIFQPFRRVASHREGTGIGLAICRKVVERHGGRIWVESQPGVGSHFRFTLGGQQG